MAEATQDAAKPARKKNAHYDVWRIRDDESAEIVEYDVAASSRKEAIGKATRELEEDSRYGAFMVIRHGEAQTFTRAKKTIVADDWGPA